jgi:hypothetical protein
MKKAIPRIEKHDSLSKLACMPLNDQNTTSIDARCYRFAGNQPFKIACFRRTIMTAPELR